MNPLVTIAVPTLDRLRYLREAVASALAQSYRDIEVVIGDDGQTIELRRWCEEVARREPRVRYQRNPRRLGLAGNWNALADAARGEYLVIIGDDDRLLPGFVSKMVEAAHPSFNVAFANHYMIDGQGRRLEAESARVTEKYRRHLLPPGEVENAEAVVWQNSVPSSAAMTRTSDVRRLRFKDDLNTPEVELFARMAREGARFVFVPEYLAEYRTHDGSATASGLLSERLVKYMLSIPVAPGVERYKRTFMEPLLVNAVSKCLQQGDREGARRYLSSQYYPRVRWRELAGVRQGVRAEGIVDFPEAGDRGLLTNALGGGVQKLCVSLPTSIGRPLYRFVCRVKSVLRSGYTHD